jgi:phosphoglucosamine mutase
MAERLFGTDGVRGRAGSYPLDTRTIRRLGAALVQALPHPGRQLRLLVGRDTRESGAWIERELAHGAQSQGAQVSSVGILSTPAVAYLTGSLPYDAGFVISASHNPFEDNGIKVFSHAGEKFTERLEGEVEEIMAGAWEVPEDLEVGVERVDLADAYLAHVRTALPDPRRLAPTRIAIDCANGATSDLAPRLFRDLGFDVFAMSCSPDGRNINLDCGSTHPQGLAAAVRQHGCRLGVAFDGDGDRAIFADDQGCIVDGDAVMLLCAKHLKATGRLRGNAVVATVMSNIGLEIALREEGIELVRCPVGDKYVMLLGLPVHRRRPDHGAAGAEHHGGNGARAAGTGRRTPHLSAGAPQRARGAQGRSRGGAGDRRGRRGRRAEAGRSRPPARALFRDRTAAAHHARRAGPGRDSSVGRGDRLGRQDAAGITMSRKSGTRNQEPAVGQPPES